jgi:glycerol-3-phosphate dehydrogenase
VHVVDHAFYRGLAAAALATPLGRLRRRRYLRELAASRRALRHWMQHGPDFQHMELILADEQARLRRDFAGARTLYERAAQRARQQEFVHHAALACERRARMLAQLRRDTEATEALREAALLYARWGAEGKAALLDRQRADLGGVGLHSER